MKLMISQPMHGKTEEEIREERKELVEQLEQEGHEVMNTVLTKEYLTADRPADATPSLWAIAKSLEALSQADGLVCMPGWDNVVGCHIEEYCARVYGKYIKYLD